MTECARVKRPRGRPRGSPNKLTADQRLRIVKEADPIGRLIAIAKGKAPRGLKEVTPDMQINAIRTLANKIMGDMKAVDLQATVATVSHEDALAALESDEGFENARRVAFMLAAAGQRSAPALPPVVDVVPEPEPSVEPVADDPQPAAEPVAAVPRSIRRPEPQPRGEVDMHDADMHGSHNGHAAPYNPHNWN